MDLSLNIADFPVATMRLVKVDGQRLCLVHTSSGVYALDNACPHEGYGLTTGKLDGEVVTCAWHNWKFRVGDGHSVLGEEDVMTHTVAVSPDGSLSVTLATPDPEVIRPKLMQSLRNGISRDYVGQMSRDVIRLLRADTNPGELMWEAVAYGAPRAEFGWGHSIASLTDCLGMATNQTGDARVLPIVQALAGVAESERGRPVNPLPEPLRAKPANPRSEFRNLVEQERLTDAQSLLRGAIHGGAQPDGVMAWFTDLVSDHLLAYGHGAIYVQKAFQLLAHIGWERADTVLPHLLPTIVYATREDTLPYTRLFVRSLGAFDLNALADHAGSRNGGWSDNGELLRAILGPDRAAAATVACGAVMRGASLEDLLDVVSIAASNRMLRYDAAGEADFHDDFGWLDITHALTYANAVRWLVRNSPDVTPDLVRLVMWTVCLANWTGRHEWHTTVGPTTTIEPWSTDLAEYGRLLQHQALQDGTAAFIVHAHAIKMSVAATEEAIRLESTAPLDATVRFLTEPRLERFVAATVTRSLDFLSGRSDRVSEA